MSDDSTYTGGYDSTPSPSYDSPSPPPSDHYPPREVEMFQPPVAVTDGDRVVGYDGSTREMRLNDAIGLLQEARDRDPEGSAEATKFPYDGLLLIPEPVEYHEVDDDEWKKIKMAAILPQRPIDVTVVEVEKDQARLESGQTLFHHTAEECSGRCCLHGTSVYATCAWPRAWNVEEQWLVHLCSHDVQHPCEAGVDYRNQELDDSHPDWDPASHECDLCCWVTDGHMTVEERLELGQEALNERLDTTQGLMADLGVLVEGLADGNAKQAEAFAALVMSVGHLIGAHKSQDERLTRDLGAQEKRVAWLEQRLEEYRGRATLAVSLASGAFGGTIAMIIVQAMR